jgi:ubiquinone/menaquinone biosynthesis C-methylase UbiE
MDDMTKLRPSSVGTASGAAEAASNKNAHDYLPAAGRDAFLPFYDLFTVAFGVSRVHRTLIDQAALAPGQQVLEIGCGTGNLSLRATRTQAGIQLIGSDPDPRALARAQRKARGLDGVRFERAYAQRLPYPDATFDRVLSSLMLHHLDIDTKVATVAEVQRVLRPGGSFHLVDFTGQASEQGHGGGHDHGHGSRGMHSVHGLLSRRAAKSGHLAESSAEDIRQMLNAAGFEGVKVSLQGRSVMGQITYYEATRPH